ncbi:TBC1 domain family member 4-like [Platysternon megacephalum]|uniref:TBC1 domain family member 4-like n=1 Tax=Platysternon megacephalum TaxID=55544 RepID=A0A4D9E438_9SAUR|nr:TBC1 domain family member 4-like [Platysternon megacephalum]
MGVVKGAGVEGSPCPPVEVEGFGGYMGKWRVEIYSDFPSLLASHKQKQAPKIDQKPHLHLKVGLNSGILPHPTHPRDRGNRFYRLIRVHPFGVPALPLSSPESLA